MRAFAEEAGGFQLVEAGEFVRRHLRFFAGQHLVHLARRGKGAVQDQVAQVLLVLERVRLGQHAAATVAEQIDLAQAERHAHGFDISTMSSTVYLLTSCRRSERPEPRSSIKMRRCVRASGSSQGRK